MALIRCAMNTRLALGLDQVCYEHKASAWPRFFRILQKSRIRCTMNARVGSGHVWMAQYVGQK